MLNTSQALNSAALSWSPTLTQLTGCPLPQGAGMKIAPLTLELHASGSMVSAQTLTVTKVQAGGTAYNTLMYSLSIPAGTVDAVVDLYALIGEPGLEPGASLTFALTATGTPAVTVYATYRFAEI